MWLGGRLLDYSVGAFCRCVNGIAVKPAAVWAWPKRWECRGRRGKTMCSLSRHTSLTASARMQGHCHEVFDVQCLGSRRRVNAQLLEIMVGQLSFQVIAQCFTAL